MPMPLQVGTNRALLGTGNFSPYYTDSFTLRAVDNVSISGRLTERQSLTWAIVGTWITQNHQLAHTGSSAGYQYATANWPSGDVIMEFDVVSSNNQSGFALRSSNSSNRFQFTQGGFQRVVANVVTTLLGASGSILTFPMRIRVIARGPLLMVTDTKGYPLVFVVDNTTAFNRTTGNHGPFDFNTLGTFDNFNFDTPTFTIEGWDSFDRADNAFIGTSDSGGVWTAGTGGANITTKQAVTTGAGDNLIYQDFSDSDGFLAVTAKYATSTVAGLAFNIQDASNYYQWVNTSLSDVRLAKVVGGVTTYLTGQQIIGNSVAGTYNGYAVAKNGKRANLFVDGIKVHSLPLPLYTSETKHGFYSNAPVTFGNFVKTNDVSLAPAPSATAPITMFYGDSLTASNTTGGVPRYPWPSKIMDSRSSSEYFGNWGISGRTLSLMAANHSTEVDVWYDAARSKNVLVIWGGTNDIYVNFADDATAYNNLVTLCTACKAVGWDIIYVNVMPRGTSAPLEAVRIVFNSRVTTAEANRAITPPPWDILCDIGSDPLIGIPGSQNNLTYFQADKIHMTVAGYDVVLGYVAAAIIVRIGY